MVITVANSRLPQICKRCTGLGSHYLTCPTLRYPEVPGDPSQQAQAANAEASNAENAPPIDIAPLTVGLPGRPDLVFPDCLHNR